MSAAAAAPRRSRSRGRSRRRVMCSASTYPARCWSGRGRARRRICRSISCWPTPPSIRSSPASFDLLASRFGVMFFADPALSFANMRKALRPSGRLAFACWREPRENPWMMAPLQAAYKHVPKLPQQGPEDPGPFAFASEARVRRILDAAGFTASRWSRATAARYRDRPRPRRGGPGRTRNRPGQPCAGWSAGRNPQGCHGFDPRSADAVRQGRHRAAAGVGLDRHGKGVVADRAGGLPHSLLNAGWPSPRHQIARRLNDACVARNWR